MTGTSAESSNTWTTYKEIVKAAPKNRHLDGVGFIIPEGYVCVNIDGRTLDDPFIKTILKRLGSYAKISVSKTGVHVIWSCDLLKLSLEQTKDGKQKLLSRKHYTKNPNNWIEVYIGGLTNRYAVYMGNAIQDKPIADYT